MRLSFQLCEMEAALQEIHSLVGGLQNSLFTPHGSRETLGDLVRLRKPGS